MVAIFWMKAFLGGVLSMRQFHDLVGLIFPFLPPYIIIYVLYFIFSQLILIVTGANME